MRPFLLFTLLAILLEWAFYAQFLEMPRLRLLGRVVVINALAGAIVLLAALTQYLYGDWPFLHSWGTRDIFLFSTAIELPFAWVTLPKLPFPKFFSLVVIANFLATMVGTAILTWIPEAIGMRPYTTAELQQEAIDNGAQIHDAIEKFRTNHGGEVPIYIYGGDEGSWSGTGRTDRLLQEGLLEVYPKNPFHLGRGYLPTRQKWTFLGLFFGTKLPEYRLLRDAWMTLLDSGREPRFGIKGIRMGNLLSDPLVPMSSQPDRYTLAFNGQPMPGAFFYRAYDIDGDGRKESYLFGVLGPEGQPGIDCYDLKRDALLESRAGHLAPASDGQPDDVCWIVGGGRLAGYPWRGAAGPITVRRATSSPDAR